MDTVCYKKRVQDTIPCPTQIVSGSSSFFESNTQRPSPDFTSKSRSTIDAGQTCHRTSLSSSSEERLLQSTFSGSEEVGRMETSHRSLPTESACYHPSLQDGNAGLCSSFSTEKRLGHFPGFIRCVFSYSNTPEIQAISSFPFYGENVSIQSPSVQVGPSPICFFQSGKSSGQALPSYGHAPSFLPGRLAPAVSVPIFVSFSQRATSGHGFVPGICSKLDQIRACSQSEFLFSGSSFLSGGRTDRTFSRQDHETGNINSENVISSISFSQTDPFPFGTNGVYGSSIAGWQSPQTLASVAHQGSLVSSGPVMGFSHFLGSLVPTSGFSMAEQGFPVHHGASLSVPTRLVSIHGCEPGWMGCSYGRLFSFRPMVSSLEGTAHQCSRTQGSDACPQMLCSHRSQLPCIAVNGQYYCSSLSEQRRGGPVANTIFHGDRSIRLVHEKTCVSLDQVCTRETECLSRLAFPERTDNSTLSQIFHLWEVPHIDLFATRMNNRLPIFISPFHDPRAWAVDAMSLSWEGMIAYAFPPIPLLMKVLLKMETETCLVILIPPCWESQPFFPVLLSLLVAPAVRIPIRKDLLIQPQSRLPHPKPEIYNLHAWLCCREGSRRRDFLRNLPRESVLRSDLPHSLSTIPDGTLGWIGVSSGRWIPSIQL